MSRMALHFSAATLSLLVLSSSACAEVAPSIEKPARFISLRDAYDHQLMETAQRLFLSSQGHEEYIDDLDSSAAEFRSKQLLTEDGIWKLAVFYEALTVSEPEPAPVVGPAPSPSPVPILERMLLDWSKRWPNSPTPRILRARQMLSAVTNTLHFEEYVANFNQSRAIEKHKLEELEEYLWSIRDVAKGDPEWFVVRAKAALLARVGEAEFRNIIREGLMIAPGHHKLVEIGTEYYMPRWGQSPAVLDAWIVEMSDIGASKKAVGTYAMAYAYTHMITFGQGFSALAWQPERLRSSILDLIRTAPSSQNLSRYALLTCLAGDHRTTQQLFEMDRNLKFGPYAKPSDRDMCFSWAKQPAWLHRLSSVSRWFGRVGEAGLELWLVLRSGWH